MVAAAPQQRILIVHIPRLTLSDINGRTPNLMKFASRSAVALLQSVSQDFRNPEQVYFAFNSGVPVKINQASSLFFNRDERYNGETVGRLYPTLTGFAVKPGNAIHLGFPRIYQLNPSSTSTYIGRFGSLLQQKGYQTAVVGNSDTDTVNRSSAAMLMNQHGLIDYSFLGSETQIRDSTFPFKRRVDSEKIVPIVKLCHKKAAVTLVTLGDLERLEGLRLNLTDRQENYYRRLIIQQYDRIVNELNGAINDPTTLTILFTALPPAQLQPALKKQASVLMLHSRKFSKGLLTSGNNKPITVYDLAVTILDTMGIAKPPDLAGTILRGTKGQWQLLNQ